MIYTDDNRGKIQYRGRASQIIDASGLRVGNITPTDVDLLIEYKGKAFIVFEFKYGDAPFTENTGQGLALKRLCDSLTNEGKTTYLLICRHHTPVGNDISAKDARVDKIRYAHRWYEWGQRETAGQVLDKIIRTLQ